MWQMRANHLKTYPDYQDLLMAVPAHSSAHCLYMWKSWFTHQHEAATSLYIS